MWMKVEVLEIIGVDAASELKTKRYSTSTMNLSG